MPPKKTRKLIVYNNYLHRKPYSFPCPSCGISIVPKDFEKHCLSHGMNSNLCCVWCHGEERWPSGQKSDHANHLHACFKHFIDPYLPRRSRANTPLATSTTDTCHSTPSTENLFESVPVPSPLAESPSFMNTDLRLLHLRSLCPVQNFFNHPSEAIQSLSRPFDLPFLLPLEPPTLPFQQDSLNKALSTLRHYLETKDRFQWLHIMIKAISYPIFLEALETDGGPTRTLAFSCWCDGGKYTNPIHRQHRHMVVVAPGKHFTTHVWSQVILAPEDKPCPRFPCKGMKRIKSPMHLVNTLGYLSQRKSRCQFTIDSKKGPRKDKHFYITQSLPIDYKKVLVTQWEKGVYDLLYQEKFQNVSLEQVIEYPMTQVGRQWKQKIKNFYKLDRGVVLPVEKRYSPTPEPTPIFLYLINGRKLYFQSDPENEDLDEPAWLQKQAQGGNCFYDNVGEDWWTPRTRDQKALKLIMREKQRAEALAQENAQLKRENAQLKRENEQWRRRYANKSTETGETLP